MQYWETLKTIVWVLKLNFTYIPILTILRIISTIGLSTFSLISSFIISVIIDTTTKNAGNSNKSYITYCIVLFALSFIFKAVLDTFRNYGDNLSNFPLSFWIPLKILYKKINYFNIGSLENPEIQNKIFRYKENSHEIQYSTKSIIIILGNLIALLAAIIPLFKIIPLITILIILSAIPNIFTNKSIFDRFFKLNKDTTVINRKGSNMISMLTNPEPLKEIKLLNAYNFIKQFFEDYINIFEGEMKKIYFHWTMYDMLNALLTGSFITFGIFQIINYASDGKISIGKIAFYIAAITSVGGVIDQLSSYISSLLGSTVKLNEMRDLLNMNTKELDKKEKIPILSSPPKIEFKNVTFHYPKSKDIIIKNLNLVINPGDKIAIVGENGAGKTTLIKLLSNIYSVTDGEILINEKNLNEIDSNSWFENIGVLYQDYNIYSDLTVRENIALGRINKTIVEDEIKTASQNADAIDFIEKYDNKFDQILSQNYEGGIRPSTGQWQKISIAKFFYRNAPILILDEPTASIDAVAEANIFERVYEFTKNKTVIIISHRFSTVRNADKIIVIDKGEIIEQGSHDSLMELNGKYANAFNIQAKGYNN